jgi:hypothetical protein
MPNHTGQCLCGDIKYTIAAEPVMAGVCHCKNCQRQAGSAFSTLWGVPKTAVNFSAGTPKCYHDANTASGGTVQRFFCGNCGSPIYSMVPAQPEMMFIKTGTLDDPDGFTPGFHIWTDRKQPWVEIPAGMPTMAKGS